LDILIFRVKLIKLTTVANDKGSFVEVLTSFSNIGPIVDFTLYEPGRQGQSQVTNRTLTRSTKTAFLKFYTILISTPEIYTFMIGLLFCCVLWHLSIQDAENKP
jgi:hypothetical protein